MFMLLSELLRCFISHDSQRFNVFIVNDDDIEQAHELAMIALKQRTFFGVFRQRNMMQVTFVAAAIVQACNDFLPWIATLVDGNGAETMQR